MKFIKKIIKNEFSLAAIAGSFLTLAFAPFHFFPAAVISLSAFFILLEKTANSKKTIFWLGFSYGFGHFLTGIYWIAISLLVDASQFAWLIPFALTLIPSALAVYIALFALSYKLLIKRFNFDAIYQKVLVFSVIWLFFEILRSILFTGFPWNLLGYIWMFNVSAAQLAKIFGVYGLSLFAALICLLPVFFFDDKGKKSFSKIANLDKIFASILVFVFIANFVFGSIYVYNSKLEQDKNVKIRLVQANIKQEMKWGREQKYQNLMKHIELTNSKKLDDVAAVIWSETSVPYAMQNNPELMRELKRATPENGVLITGALRVSYSPEGNMNGVWNSVFSLDKNGISNSYDKHHLVPFGEYVPLQKYLPFINKITDGAVGFSKGDGPKTIPTKKFSFSPLICYEVIFSNKALNRKDSPDLLVNLTNDAWFGESSGPYQHLDMARMRSIEYGISMARVANTGVSAFINPFGEIVDRIVLNQSGIFDVFLTKKLAPTFYEKYRYSPLILLLAIIGLFLKFFRKK